MTWVLGATPLPDPTWGNIGYTAQYQERVQLGATAVVVNSLIDTSQDAPEFREQDVEEKPAPRTRKAAAKKETK